MSEQFKNCHPQLLKRFYQRLLLFFSPLLVVILGFEVMLFVTGETIPISQIIQEQQKDQAILFSRGILSQDLADYKLQGFLRANPKIIALGSSRVLQFRSEMFGSDRGEFYNAGKLVESVEDLEAFVRTELPKSRVKTVLLGIDHFWFNPNYHALSGYLVSGNVDSVFKWQAHLSALRTVLFNPRQLAKLLVATLLARQSSGRGAYAILDHSGFRSDGSFKYGLPEPPNDVAWKMEIGENESVAKRIKARHHQFLPAEHISVERLQRFEHAIELMQHEGIQIFAFFPPFTDTAMISILSDPSQNRVWKEFLQKIPPILDRHHVIWIDASNPTAIGLGDRYMLDDIHGSEVYQLYVLKKLLERDLTTEIARPAYQVVQKALSEAKNHYWYASSLNK